MDETDPLLGGWQYDAAILAWRQDPTRSNWDAMIEAQKAYYGALRTLDLDSPLLVER